MTYNVFGGMLNLAQSIYSHMVQVLVQVSIAIMQASNNVI